MSGLHPYNARIATLTGLGIPFEKAEAQARNEFGLPAADVDGRRDRILEKTEQREVVKRFKVCGFSVYNLSQARATKQTPGLPDNYFVHASRGVAVWWEAKRQVGGKFSPAQTEFAESMGRCRVPYGAGDRYAAEAWLIANGFAAREPGCRFVPAKGPQLEVRR